MNGLFEKKLKTREPVLTLRHAFENSKADSGGDRDLNFLKFLFDSKLLGFNEAILKRKEVAINEEFYLDRYKKMSHESDRHFLCRTVIQRELMKLGIETFYGCAAGDLSILRENSNYDIVFADFSCLVDIGLTPARNYFRGLTDLRTSNYLLTSYFDDYMDDIIFCNFFRLGDQEFLDAVRDYQEGLKPYTPAADNPYIDGVDLHRFI